MRKKRGPITEETRRRMIESHKWKPSWMKWKKRSKETIEKILRSRRWYKHSEETKLKMSETRKWRKLTDAQKKAISDRQKWKTSWMKWKKASDETKRKQSEALKWKYVWELNSQWQWWISRLPYAIDRTSTLRKSIRERDHYTCRICMKQQWDKSHAIHHIDYDKKNCNPINLITLCNSCHGKTNSNRKYWENMLGHLIWCK